MYLAVIAKTLCCAAKATSASREAEKLTAAHYSSFYDGFTQKDASECLFMLLGIKINMVLHRWKIAI